MKTDLFKFINTYGPIKRKELLIMINNTLLESITDRKMRSTIEEMVTNDGYLIASGKTGYSVVRTVKELNKCVEYLKKKAKPIAIRANCLIASFNKYSEEATEETNQLKFDLLL